MLPRAEAPARRLPYTTADMSERLAKRKAEQDAAAQAQANQALRFGVTNPPVKEDKGGGGLWPSWKELGNAGKIGLGGVAGIVNTAVATPLDMADFGVQQLEKLVGVKPTDKFDPASVGSFNLLGETYRGVDRAANYVAGNIAATPGFGKPSSSPFMDTLRSKGVAEALAEPLVHAVNVGSVAYPVSKVAVGAKFPETIANAYRQRLLERDIAAQNNLFPTVQRPANVIDVDALQGSRLPARVVDSPAPPATRLAEAQGQRALPAVGQRRIPTSSQLTVEKINVPKGPNTFHDVITIRSFDKTTNKYTGVLTISYDPITKKATVTGMGATNPMVTPQLIAAAATEVRKLVGDVKFPLTPSTDLSASALPFVERLQAAGLIDPNYQLPDTSLLNDISKDYGPLNFAPAVSNNQIVIDPSSYQPTYNNIFKALAETKRASSPATPASRLAEAQTQRALPPAATRALPPAKIAPIEVETVASSLESPEYRGQHGAPGKGAGAPLHDMLEDGGIYPKDVYSANAIRFYGVGDDKLDAIAANLIKKYKGQPNAEVTIYRAVPKNISLDDAQIIAGDWVTPIREYAMMHGDGALRGEYQIIEKQVKAKDVYTAGDSWLEWGYDPQSPLPSPATRLAEAQTQRQIITTPSTQLPAEYLALANETPITQAFTTSVEANQYLAGNGSLEQLEKVAPGYLWEAVENNSTASLPSGRFKQIGSGGGWVGMDRYVDQATGKHFGLKMRPGMRQFEAEWHPGPMAEILSNDIAVSLGFPDMNLRLIRNSDDSISLITDLAQDVYGGTIADSFQAALHGENNNWLPSIASRVPIEDRIRMAVLDDLINNGDRHSGNILYSVNDDGSVRLVPIDHEVSFQSPGGGTPRRFAQTYEFNVSVRQAYLEDPTKLFEDIKTAIAKIQQELKQKTPDILENFESKLVKTSEQFGIPRGRYINRPVTQLEDDLTKFLNDTPDQIAQKYWNQIAEGFQF